MNQVYSKRWVPIWRLRLALRQSHPHLDEITLAKMALERGWACRYKDSTTKRLRLSQIKDAERSLRYTENHLKISHKTRILSYDAYANGDERSKERHFFYYDAFDTAIAEIDFMRQSQYYNLGGILLKREPKYFKNYFAYYCVGLDAAILK